MPPFDIQSVKDANQTSSKVKERGTSSHTGLGLDGNKRLSAVGIDDKDGVFCSSTGLKKSRLK